MRVLIVEDEPTSARLLEATVAHFGNCERAANGQECFEKFCSAMDEGKPFDLIFLDIMMPGVDGQEALAAIREVEEGAGVAPDAGVKIVMTTALDDPQSLYHAHFSGCSEYLVKPIRREDLLRTLKRLGVSPEVLHS
ncbi:MAG: response regulator [Deltaproteobacteria bacterium]|nr:response regulator [Deltaproteobacteria bacterium]